MKLKKLLKLYNGDFLQLKDSKTDSTTLLLNKYEIRHDYWNYLGSKVLHFEIVNRFNNMGERIPVLWIEII